MAQLLRFVWAAVVALLEIIYSIECGCARLPARWLPVVFPFLWTKAPKESAKGSSQYLKNVVVHLNVMNFRRAPGYA